MCDTNVSKMPWLPVGFASQCCLWKVRCLASYGFTVMLTETATFEARKTLLCSYASCSVFQKLEKLLQCSDGSAISLQCCGTAACLSLDGRVSNSPTSLLTAVEAAHQHSSHALFTHESPNCDLFRWNHILCVFGTKMRAGYITGVVNLDIQVQCHVFFQHVKSSKCDRSRSLCSFGCTHDPWVLASSACFMSWWHQESFPDCTTSVSMLAEVWPIDFHRTITW